MSQVTITHPGIEGSEVSVPESSVPFHQAAGWVVKGSEDDPEVKAAAERDQSQGGDKGSKQDPGDPAGGAADAGGDQAPKSRRASKKEADA